MIELFLLRSTKSIGIVGMGQWRNVQRPRYGWQRPSQWQRVPTPKLLFARLQPIRVRATCWITLRKPPRIRSRPNACVRMVMMMMVMMLMVMMMGRNRAPFSRSTQLGEGHLSIGETMFPPDTIEGTEYGWISVVVWPPFE